MNIRRSFEQAYQGPLTRVRVRFPARIHHAHHTLVNCGVEGRFPGTEVDCRWIWARYGTVAEAAASDAAGSSP